MNETVESLIIWDVIMFMWQHFDRSIDDGNVHKYIYWRDAVIFTIIYKWIIIICYFEDCEFTLNFLLITQNGIWIYFFS